MRSLALRRALLLAGVVVTPFACVNNDSSPNAAASFDGGQGFDARVEFDAALPDGSLPDLTQPPPPDLDASDAADAAPTFAGVTVLGTNGLPRSGVAVVFQDAAGTVLETKTSDAFGRVTRDVVTGGMVTVAVGGAGQRELFTFFAIKNGDEILALDVAPPPSSVPQLSVDPPPSPPVGTFTWAAQAGDCTSGSSIRPPALVYLDPPCFNKGAAPVSIIAADEASNPMAWAFKAGNALAADGGVAAVTGLSAWSTIFGTFGVTLTNVPSFDPTQSVSVLNGQVLGGVVQHDRQFVAPTEGTATGTLRTMPGYAQTLQPQVNIGFSSPSADSTSLLAKSIGAAATAQTFDLTQMWSVFASVSSDSTDAARPKMGWTVNTAGPGFPGADGGFSRVQWTAQVDGGFDNAGWTFVFPPTSVSPLQAPQMPSALSAWVPPAAMSFGSPTVGMVDEDDIPGYTALLARYPVLLGADTRGGTVKAPALPPNATLRATFALPPG